MTHIVSYQKQSDAYTVYQLNAPEGSTELCTIDGVTPNTTSTYTVIGKGITNLITAFNFYGSISVGADLTEHQRHLCESYLGRKSGVQL